MSLDELSLSITAATDALDQVVSLQELLFISLDIAGQSSEKRQARTELLTMCYLHEVKPYLEELRQELEEIRQLVPRAYGGQMSAKHSAGLAAEKV
jgi:D-arabinose 1-dehydrogenase-like Zn-dependent alcohol dehydrogenase